MSSQAETDAVWKSMPGAQPLFEFYGYWPTLHDAVVRAVSVDFAGRGLEVTVDYCDLPKEGNGEGYKGHRITLRWEGIVDAKLRLTDGDLYGVEFTQGQGVIETRFDDYVWGMDGSIVSASVYVTRIEGAPDMSGLRLDDPAHDEIRFSLT